MRGALRIGGVEVLPGQQMNIDLPVARLHTHTELTMPVRVIRGKDSGPSLFVTAAIHGDEINGVEIIRRILRLPQVKKVRGTLIAVPVVNVFAFIEHSRYLPDRRDLNRSFPGSERGSLAARLADLFMTEIARNSTHGIDLHTGSIHRPNLPQVRILPEPPEVERLARAFGCPVILVGDQPPDGSLRKAVAALNVPVLVYEGGEALRFDEVAIREGVRGVLGVMHALGMLTAEPPRGRARPEPLVARSSLWVRAPQGGILRHSALLGGRVQRGDELGIIGDPFGDNEVAIYAPVSGIIIGRFNLPLVNEGDALFHIAQLDGAAPARPQEREETLPPALAPEAADESDGKDRA